MQTILFTVEVNRRNLTQKLFTTHQRAKEFAEKKYCNGSEQLWNGDEYKEFKTVGVVDDVESLITVTPNRLDGYRVFAD
tara:strand:- start:140 stop:376 length:237 start_codon:yes stop_codon:yes gene_type:complete